MQQRGNHPLHLVCLIIILPFILLYWMMPFLSDLSLGADYPLFSINDQLSLLFSIKTGSFPLYVSGFNFGHSSSALTLGQVYHPISHIASLLPGYWNGKALEWNTFLRLLTLGLTHLMLFVFLKKIKVNTLFSFLLSLITVYNLRMLEAFRYGASLEAYTGNLWLCTLIGWYFISPSRWFGPLCITGATYLLICSGHPPMMFFGLVGAGIFTLVVPFFLATMLPDKDINFKIALRFWIKVIFYVIGGILLSSAYILPFYFEFVTKNIEYTNFGLQPNMGQDTITGVLNNFFMPLAADTLSTFGGSSLIMMSLLLPLLRCFKVRIPAAVWAIWGILLLAYLYILGPETPVFRLAWEYLPFVSSAGGVGRISIIIPSLMMLLLAWIVNAESFQVRFKTLSIMLTPYALLALIALILIPLYLLPVFLFKPSLGYFTPHFIRKLPFWIEFVSVIFGMVSLAALVLYGKYPRLASQLGILLCLIVLLHTGTLLKYGTFIEKKYDKPTFEQMKNDMKEKLIFNFYPSPSMFHSVVLNHIRNSFVDPFLGKIFTQVLPVDSQDHAYRKMEQNRLPQYVFVEGYDNDKAREITEAAIGMTEGKVELIYFSFNRLQFKVNSQSTAIFGLSYPYTGHWNAWVNGNKVNVYRANGAAHAVEIPKGESSIEFRYRSDVFLWGMLISCTSFALIGLFVCFRGLKGSPRLVGIIIIPIISVCGFMLWYDSLHSGDNLEAQYLWEYAPPSKSPNLAYGKKTPSNYFHNSSMLRHYSGYAVDGNTTPGSGVPFTQDEALIVDLNQIQKIRRIVLYGEVKKESEISLSQDNLQWQRLTFDISEHNKSAPLRIIFESPTSARFIKVQAKCSAVVIDELEVYGPEPI
jgi:hypothetical protein